jgi:hypothetical protein
MTIDNAPHPTAAQALMVFGVMGYGPGYMERRQSFLARSAFDNLVEKAKKRGFKDRPKLIGAMRRGKATPGAMRHIDAVCALLQTVELTEAFARAAAWDYVQTTGRVPPGWQWTGASA